MKKSVLFAAVVALSTTVEAASLEQQVRDLQATVLNQEARIQKLEKLLSSPKSAAQAQQQISQDGWTKPSQWNRIKRGMSYGQVKSILGNPHSIKDLGDGQFRTYFYNGYVSGSGEVAGKLEFNDGQIYIIKAPVF